MKNVFKLSFILAFVLTAFTASAQQPAKKARVSPPDTVRATLKKGKEVEIAYSQPSIKGRAIGTDLATYGKIWRTGANEATTISFSKDVKVEGKPLKAGKYALYTIPGENEWVIIFNSGIKNWGTVYKQEEDVLRVTVKTQNSPEFTEQLKFKIDKSGLISFMWGDKMVAFKVK